MSLLSYSSPWFNEDSDRSNNAMSRKRTPTMGGVPRKTIKVRPNNESSGEQYSKYDSNGSSSKLEDEMPTIQKHEEIQNNRTDKINSLLNKITSFSTDNKLGDFNPIPYPTTITKKNADEIIQADEPIEIGKTNPLMPKTTKSDFFDKPRDVKSAYYRASDPKNSNYSTYREAYGKEGLIGGTKEPYYAKMGISKGSELSGDKVIDRLNYMTQMLESMQMEKTNHVTEEFVLYSLLGVFMIYIVDGFSRNGKYIR